MSDGRQQDGPAARRPPSRRCRRAALRKTHDHPTREYRRAAVRCLPHRAWLRSLHKDKAA